MRVDSPRGIVPRSNGCNLPPNYASKAENLNTQSGRFEPWRQPRAIIQFHESVLAVHVRDCCWTGDCDPCTTYVDAGVERQTFRSKPGDCPMVTGSVCDPDWTYLGYPVPDPPGVYVDQGTPVDKGPDTESRSYRITYGTDCEEGPASCPTEAIDVTKDTLVGLTLPEPPSKNYGITHVNVYQSNSMWDSSQGLADLSQGPVQDGYLTPATVQEYFLVDRIPLSQRHLVLQDPKSGSLLTTEFLLPPPEGSQLVGETLLGSTVIYWDDSIAFSERNKYWGYPLKTWHDFPHKVLDVKVCQNTVFVLTSGATYVIQDDVDCTDSNARPVLEIKEESTASPCPACVVLPDGILYTTPKGLARLGVDGSFAIVSGAAFGSDDWQSLGPIRSLTKSCGRLMVSTDRLEYVWDLVFDDRGQLPADLTSLSFHVDQWLTDDQDALYFLAQGSVYEFNAGDRYMQLDWWQAEQRLGSRQKISAFSIEYVKKNTVNRNQLMLYRNGNLSVSKEMSDTPRKIRSSLAMCNQLRVKGDEPMCALMYGQGLTSLRGDRQ